VASASPGVVYSFSSMAPTMPSSSPPTTPTSISSTTLAAAASASRSWAICRFSSSGTAEPSHMCGLEHRVLAARHPLLGDASSGRTNLSSLSFGQWSVCSAMFTGYFLATSRA
jgi:hypothetical protein